jgi:hypothetical protein
VQATGIVIAPMGIGEVLDAGFSLARRHYRSLLRVSAWGAVPAYAALGLGGALGTGSRPSLIALSVILIVLGVVGLALMGVAVAIACARLIEPADGQDGLDAVDIYSSAVMRLGPMIPMGFVWIALAVPFVILLPVGIFVGGRWAMSYAAIALEPIGPIEALRRSWQMTRGSWWHTVIVMAAAELITSMVTFVLAAIFGAVAGIIGALTGSQALSTMLAILTNGIPGIAVQPFGTAIMVVLYYELRARSEGLDLSQRFARLAAIA